MSTLGSLLVQSQVVSVTQIEQALQHQVIYGGDLATNLLELGLIDEDILAEQCARSLGIPMMLREMLDVPNIRAIQKLSWAVATEHHVLPIRLEEGRMTVAVSSPFPFKELEEVAFVMNVTFDPYFVLDFRLAMGLNRHYGVPIPSRLLALQQKFAPEFERDQPPTVQPQSNFSIFSSAPDNIAPPIEQESEKNNTQVDKGRIISINPPASAEAEPSTAINDENTIRVFPGEGTMASRISAIANATNGFQGDDDTSGEPDEDLTTFGAAWPESSHETSDAGQPSLSLSEARSLLANAQTRDEIFDIAVRFARQAFEYMVLFVVHGDMAQAFTASWGNKQKSNIDHIMIPINKGGMFGTAFDTRSFFLGPPGTTEADRFALQTLGRDAQVKNCTILPVTLRQRVIVMIYGDAGNKGIRPEQVSGLTRFSRFVGDAFEKILLKKKYGEYKPVGLSVIPKPSLSKRQPPVVEKESLESSAGRYHVQSNSTLIDQVAPQRKSRPPGLVRRSSPPARRSSIPPSRTSRPPEYFASNLPSERLRSPSRPPKKPAAAEEHVDIRSTKRLYDTGENTGLVWPPDSTVQKESPTTLEDSVPPSTGQSISRPVISISEVPPPVRPSEPLPSPIRDSVMPETSPSPQISLENAIEETPVVASSAKSKLKNSAQRSIIVEMNEEIERLVERILSPGRFDETAADLLVGIGDDAIKILMTHFPGPLLYDRYQDSGRLPKISSHGPLLRTIIKFDKKAVPHLIPMFDSVDSDVRFYAVFAFSELKHPEALDALTTRIFDNDRQIRALAIDVLRGFNKFPEYRRSTREILNVLTNARSSIDAKRIAAQSLGELRESTAVHSLAEMLASVDAILVERCHRALVKITFNDFGFSHTRWLTWLEHHKQHRIEWAIESLCHAKEQIRHSAIRDLKEIVEEGIKWPRGPMDHKQRQELRRKCRLWWRSEGWALFPYRED